MEIGGVWRYSLNPVCLQKTKIVYTYNAYTVQLYHRGKIQHTVLVVMDFESCFERIWRAGLLHKASNKGINERVWLYIKNSINDRK